MLNSMRTLSKSIVSKLLMLLLVVSFGVWGVGDILRSSGPSYAALVGHETIGIGEFQQQRSQVARNLQNIGMTDLPPGKLEAMVIRKMVQEKLTLMAMRDMGLFVNEKLLGSIVAEIADFQDVMGHFSAKIFAQKLAQQHLSEAAFLEQVKREVAGRFLIDSMSMEDATPPLGVLTLEATRNGETRDAVLFTIPAKNALDEDNTTALKAYYEANKTNLYMNPETRTLDYVTLAPAQLDSLVNKGAGESRDVAIHELGNTIEDELAAGKTMAQAFQKANLTVTPRTLEKATPEMAKTGDDDVVHTVVQQGFTLSEGEVSRLITSKKGTLLMVAVKKITAASPKPYEEVKADVKARLAKELSAEAAKARALTVKNALGKSPNWQAVADAEKLSSHVLSNIGRPNGKALADIPPALQQSLFEHAVGEVAGPLTCLMATSCSPISPRPICRRWMYSRRARANSQAASRASSRRISMAAPSNPLRIGTRSSSTLRS